jgi:exopolysaccharide biosynthesis protein
MAALRKSVAKKNKNAVAISGERFQAFSAGKCAQILHIGPSSEEGPSIENGAPVRCYPEPTDRKKIPLADATSWRGSILA